MQGKRSPVLQLGDDASPPRSMPSLLQPSPSPDTSADAAPPLSPVDLAVRIILGITAVLALAGVLFACMAPIAVTDFWWQARTGYLIVHNGHIPTRDPFSWTAQGQPWLVHEWLTEIFFYFALTNLPNWVLLLYKCGLSALVAGMVLVRSWMRSRSLPISIAAAVAMGMVLRNYADLRPQMLTFVLLAGLLLALDEYHQGRMRRLPWVMPFVFLLWANLHGGVVVGLVLMILWVAGDALGLWLFGHRSEGLRALAIGLAASCLMVAVNPNGFHIYTYPFQVLGHPQVADYISEWWAPNFHSWEMRPFELLLLIAFGAMSLSRRERLRVGEALVILAMAHAALMSQRNTVPFGMAAAPVAAAGLATLWREAGVQPLFRRVAEAAPLRVLSSLALAGGVGWFVWWAVPRVPASRWFEYAIRMQYFPRGAVAMMENGYWPGRLYNDYAWGGYLIWKLYGIRPVFIDGRAEVYYPTGAFEDEMTIHNTSDGWAQALDKWKVDVVLTQRGSGLAGALSRSPGWKLAFTGEAEVVYTRAGAVSH